MNYHLKSKFGKFVSDYGLLWTYIGFLILAAIYLITENIAYGFSSLWILGGVIVSYIDYKVEQLETRSYHRRMFLLDEITRLHNDSKVSNSPPLE